MDCPGCFNNYYYKRIYLMEFEMKEKLIERAAFVILNIINLKREIKNED